MHFLGEWHFSCLVLAICNTVFFFGDEMNGNMNENNFTTAGAEVVETALPFSALSF